MLESFTFLVVCLVAFLFVAGFVLVVNFVIKALYDFDCIDYIFESLTKGK